MILSPSTQNAMGHSCIVQQESTTIDRNLGDRNLGDRPLGQIHSVYQSDNELAGMQNAETQSPIKNKLTRAEINDKLGGIKATLHGIKTEYLEVALPQTHLSISRLTLTKRWADLNEQLKKPLEWKSGRGLDDLFPIFSKRFTRESQGRSSTFSDETQPGRDLLRRNAIHFDKKPK